MNKQYRTLEERDLQVIWEIEQKAHAYPWSKSTVNDIAGRGASHLVLLMDENIVGYFYAQKILDELTLLNIAVEPKQQNKGYGRALIEKLLLLAEEQKIKNIWLEVRESNKNAYYLYEKMGFNEVDRRKNYYPDKNKREDALIMNYFILGDNTVKGLIVCVDPLIR